MNLHSILHTTIPPAILHKLGWLFITVLAVYLCTEPPLQCRCSYGSVKREAAIYGYGLIASRSFLAVLLGTKTHGWIVQLMFIIFLAPIIVEIVIGIDPQSH